MKPIAALVCVLAAGGARAEPDGFGLGDGHLGARVISSLNTPINVSVALATPVSAGGRSLTVASTSGFAQGTLVMLLQLTGEPTPDGGEPSPSSLGASTGSWELARVASTGGGQLLLTAPLAQSFTAALTQVVSVPEYTDLTVVTGASVVASPWTGFTGGIIALLATGRVAVDGAVDATGAGFRGGLYVAGSGNTGCTRPDAPFPDGSQKGEGVGAGYGALTGFGRALNGGGGGVCYLSGGGGGGNAGPGGQGGRTNDGARDVGGRGGLALKYALPGRLTLGGGGGAGQGNVTLGTGGGRGGGVVFIRAGEVSGAGFIRSNGESALTAAGNSGGNTSPGGGGAGGTIVLQVARGLGCGGVEVNGGNGGNSNGPNNAAAGPGGGGGGGRIFIEATDSATCPLSILCGVAGLQGGSQAGPHRDAWPQSASDPMYTGSITVTSTGYLALADAGLADAGVVDAGIAAPRFLSRAVSFAFCGQPYGYSSSGEPSVVGAGPLVFSLGGESVPEGLTVDAGTGALVWTPSRAQEGVNRFELIASGPGGSAVESIEVGVLCRDERLGIGCACAAGEGSGVVLLLLGFFASRRRAPG